MKSWPAWLRRLTYAFVGLAGLLLALALLGPPIARQQIERIASAELGRTVSVERVGLNPLTLTATIHGLQIDQPGAPPLLRAGMIQVSASLSSLAEGAPVLRRVRAENTELNLERTAPTRFNFSDILDRLAAKPPNPEPARFAVSNLELEGGNIRIQDRVRQREHRIQDLTLRVPFISSFIDARDVDVEPALSAVVDGAALKLDGDTLPFKDTRETTLNLNLDGVDLTRYADLLAGVLPIQIKRATLSTRLQLAFRLPGKGTPSALQIRGYASLSGAQIEHARHGELLTFTQLSVNGLELAPLEGPGRYRVEHVRLERPEFNLRRSRDGEIEVTRLLNPVPAPASAPAPDRRTRPDWSAGRVELVTGRLNWLDSSVKPAAAVTLDAIEVAVVGLTGTDQAADLQFSARVSAPPRRGAKAVSAGDMPDADRIQVAGRIVPMPLRAELGVQLQRVGLARLLPYAKPWLPGPVGTPTLSATLPITYSSPEGLAVKAGEFELADVRLAPAQAPRRSILGFDRLKVSGADLQVGQRRAEIGRIALSGLSTEAVRGADGRINLQGLLALPEAPASSTAAPPKATPWRWSVGELDLDAPASRWTDRAVEPAVDIRLAGTRLKLQSLQAQGSSSPRFSVESRIGASGRLRATGSAQLAALVPQGLQVQADLRNLDPSAVQAYLQPRLNVQLERMRMNGNFGARWQSASARSPMGVAINGRLGLAGVRALDRVNGAEVLQIGAIDVRGIDVRLGPIAAAGPREPRAAPPGDRIAVDAVAVDDFFVRLILDAQGRLNLRDLVVEEGAAPRSLTDATPDQVAPTAGKDIVNTPPSIVPAPAAASAGTPRSLFLGGVSLTRGTVNFTDNFVRPNYTVNLTQFTGRIGAMSSDNARPAELAITAKVDDDAPVNITGRLNVLAPKIFTDIAAEAQRVELTRLTPYSGKYMGYPIEKGKLSAKLRYVVENDALRAENEIFLDQLTFGPRQPGESIFKLPVLLAVSLLKNARGEININLPVSGSISDPKFSVGGVVWQVLVNLLTKAVTAPFSLLADAFGGGDELSFVAFEPGSATLDAAARQRIGVLAKAMADRPGIRLDINGRADPARDTEALKKFLLEERLAELRRRGLRAPDSANETQVSEGRSIATPTPTSAPDAAERERLLRLAYREASIPKPRNLIGLARDLPVADMEALLLTHTAVGSQQLTELANRRSSAVKAALAGAGAPEDRLFLVASRTDAQDIKDGPTTRVDFALRN